MKDSRGISLGYEDIVARRTNIGWRISRVVVIGYTDRTKREPLVICVDFERNGASTSTTWQQVVDSSKLQRLAGNAELKESSEELLKRLPDLAKVLDDFELHQLAENFSGVSV